MTLKFKLHTQKALDSSCVFKKDILIMLISCFIRFAFYCLCNLRQNITSKVKHCLYIFGVKIFDFDAEDKVNQLICKNFVILEMKKSLEFLSYLSKVSYFNKLSQILVKVVRCRPKNHNNIPNKNNPNSSG